MQLWKVIIFIYLKIYLYIYFNFYFYIQTKAELKGKGRQNKALVNLKYGAEMGGGANQDLDEQLEYEQQSYNQQ